MTGYDGFGVGVEMAHEIFELGPGVKSGREEGRVAVPA